MARPTYDASEIPASARSLVRVARTVAGVTDSGADGVSLEGRFADASAPARITPAELSEPGTFARAVPGTPAATFGAFLDGVQDSRAVAWLPSGVPIVVAAFGAVVLERLDGALSRWADGLRTRRVLLVPRDRVDPDTWHALASAGDVEDTKAEADARHPDALLLRAVHAVEELRAGQERELAAAWVDARREPLYVDGGIGSLGAAANATGVVGVVKSHRTIYVEPDALSPLFALAEGERTRVRTIPAGAYRPAAWTWYLRLREPSPSDPLHGLVRIEVAPRSDGDATACADDVSRWVLAERSPLSLPDGRWDVLAYGIARCETYLKRGLALRGPEVRA